MPLLFSMGSGADRTSVGHRHVIVSQDGMTSKPSFSLPRVPPAKILVLVSISLWSFRIVFFLVSYINYFLILEILFNAAFMFFKVKFLLQMVLT